MPLFSDQISNMYYSGASSYSSAPYGYSSSVSPLGSSFSASYLNPGGNYSSHSSLGGYSRAPLTSRWMPSSGRTYSPLLSTISEKGTSSPIRINSPRRVTISKRTYASPSYTPRPININTADIDVSKDKYKPKNDNFTPVPPQKIYQNVDEGTKGPFMPRVDGKPETGIDSSPGQQRNTIKRGRTVVRLHTLKRKERDSPRKAVEVLQPQSVVDDGNDNKTVSVIDDTVNDEPTEAVGWRERLSEDLVYRDKRDKKTLGEKLVEKFTLKDSESSVKEPEKKQDVTQSLPIPPLSPAISTNRSPERRYSLELLAEQANILDSLIRNENLSTLDLSKVGTYNESKDDEVKRRKLSDKENPLKTTKSDHSLHERIKFRDPKHFSKRRSLKKSSSGSNIRRLDSITEIPRDFPAIEESILAAKLEASKSKLKPKLKTKITSSVEVTSPPNPLKFKIENMTVEEKVRSPKKEIIFSSAVDEIPEQNESALENDELFAPRRSKVRYTKKRSKNLVNSDDNISPQSEDGNFWEKIGKRETIYLIKRKQNIDDAKEKSRRALFWFPEEEESRTDDIVNKNNDVTIENIGNENKDESLKGNLNVAEENIKVLNLESNDTNKDVAKNPDTVMIETTTPHFKQSETENLKDNEVNTIDIDAEEKIPLSNSILQNTCFSTNAKNILQKTISLPNVTKNTAENKNEVKKNSSKLNSVTDKNIPSNSMNHEKIEPESTEIKKDESEILPINNEEEKTYKEDSKLNQSSSTKSEETKSKSNRTETQVSSALVITQKSISVETVNEQTDLSNNQITTEKQNYNTSNVPNNKKHSKKEHLSKDENCAEEKLDAFEAQKSNTIISHENTAVIDVSSDIKDENQKEDVTITQLSLKEETCEVAEKKLDVSEEQNLTTCNENAVIDNFPAIPIVIESVNIPNKSNDENTNKGSKEQKQQIGENDKAENTSEKEKTEDDNQQLDPNDVVKLPPPVLRKKPVKDEPALRPLIATPRPLQKRTPQVIHSSSSSETSSEEDTSDDDDNAEESDTSENSTELFESENNPDGRTSTGSNDSGFDSSAPTSPAGFAHIKKGDDSPGPSSSSASAQTNATNILEQEIEQSTAYSIFRSTGRFTPPARSIPRFRKYAIEDFHFIKVLGKGSFGKVLLAELRDTEYYYAVKCLKKDVVLEDDDVECTLIERKVLALGTNHPYLCHLFATFQTDSHLFFVMEYLNGGDLMFHIQQSGRFPEIRARFYGAEIVSGLKFLHKRGIIYRDLKLDNILLDYEGHVRIADFGMCKLQIYLDKTADTFCGTPDYMAPEIIKGVKYSQNVDWWSFGVLLYEMLIGQSPFSGCDEDELFWSICNEIPSYPRFLSQEALSILTRLLDKDARTRLGSTECMYGDIREQDFFRPIHWDKLERRELEAPFKPRVRHPLDTQYFDRAFTGERPRLTAVEPQVLRSMDQEPFRGFSYTNPNATDR